jgi:hypothetical protein
VASSALELGPIPSRGARDPDREASSLAAARPSTWLASTAIFPKSRVKTRKATMAPAAPDPTPERVFSSGFGGVWRLASGSIPRSAVHDRCSIDFEVSQGVTGSGA